MSRRKTFEPGAPVVPGAERVTRIDESGVPVPVYESYGKGMKKQRPVWKMPVPERTVPHFRNAAMKARYASGDVTMKKATQPVPIYRGYDRALVRYVRSQMRRHERKMAELKARVANQDNDLGTAGVA